MSNPILVTRIKMQPQNIQYPVVKMQPHPAAHTHLPTTGKSPPPPTPAGLNICFPKQHVK